MVSKTHISIIDFNEIEENDEFLLQGPNYREDADYLNSIDMSDDFFEWDDVEVGPHNDEEFLAAGKEVKRKTFLF